VLNLQVVETPRSSRLRSGCNSARTERSHQNRSSGSFQLPSSQRKAYSSKARLPSQIHDHLKEKDERVISRRHYDHIEPKQFENSQRTKSSSLISRVGDLDLSDSHDSTAGEDYAINGHHGNERLSKVFEFVSRPHSLPRESVLPEKESNSMETSLSTSVPSKHDIRERIQEKINRLTPTPRSSSSSPKTLRNIREVKNSSKTKPIRPPSSVSPDLSLSHSGHTYNSAKYSDGMLNSIEATPVNKSIMSLKSSDATLTGSVDTLVQTSLYH